MSDAKEGPVDPYAIIVAQAEEAKGPLVATNLAIEVASLGHEPTEGAIERRRRATEANVQHHGFIKVKPRTGGGSGGGTPLRAVYPWHCMGDDGGSHLTN